MTSREGQRLLVEAEGFCQKIIDLLAGTVVPNPPVGVEMRRDRAVVGSFDGQGNIAPMAIPVRGVPAIALGVLLKCCWDSYGDFLAIETSSFRIYLAGRAEPFVRYEYVRREDPPKSAHIHLHGENSALGYLFAVGQAERAPNMQSLHLLVGGKRFRPTLEDVVEFMVDDLGADAQPDWRRVVEQGRAEWFEHQVGAVVREFREVARETLERYPPPGS